jgi:glycosyltransferase involved in cell wall biosynthesis
MRVVHVGNYKPDSSNGVDKTIVGMTRHLLAQGVKVEVWHPTVRAARIEERIEDGLTIRDLPVRRIFKGVTRLKPEARHFVAQQAVSVELFHFHSVFSSENIRLSKLGVPYVITPNGGYDALSMAGRNRIGKSIWFSMWERSYLRGASLIHAVSIPEQRELLALRLDVPVKYIPNGIEQNALRIDAPAPSKCRELLYLGRLAVEQKGLDLLLTGYARALADVPDLPHLVLAGPDFRGGMGRLTGLVGALNLAGKVVLAGPVFGEAKWQQLSQARLFIHTSRWEGMPFALLEAMAVGRPVLVTPGSNLAEYVHEFGAGVVVDCDAAAIAAGLKKAASSTDAALDKMGRRSRDLAKARFSWQSIAVELGKEYRSIVAH